MKLTPAQLNVLARFVIPIDRRRDSTILSETSYASIHPQAAPKEEVEAVEQLVAGGYATVEPTTDGHIKYMRVVRLTTNGKFVALMIANEKAEANLKLARLYERAVAGAISQIAIDVRAGNEMGGLAIDGSLPLMKSLPPE